MTENTDTTEITAETTAPEVVDEHAPETTEPADPETFPREYVQKLRDENAKYRQRAQRADDLAHRLHTALVAATGRLADPEDLPFDEAHLDDPDALRAAVEDLLARKPHLASRIPHGNIGQGATVQDDSVSLAGILRAAAS